MKKYDFKKLVLMGVAGATLTISSVSAAGAYDDSTYTPTQTKKTTKTTTTSTTKPTAPQKNSAAGSTNANYSSNARGYNYTADNSTANEPKPTPYRSNHPFDNRYATDDKSAIHGDDSNFTLPNSATNGGPGTEQNRASSVRTNPQNMQNRGPAQNTWSNNPSTQGKSSDELADDYNSYQQRMGSKNWYGDNANPSSGVASPRSSDGVYYEDMTNQNRRSGSQSGTNSSYGSQQQQQQQQPYGSNSQQPYGNAQYGNAQPVGAPRPISAPTNAQQQGRIIHSDNSYHGGGGGSCKSCGGGGSKP